MNAQRGSWNLFKRGGGVLAVATALMGLVAAPSLHAQQTGGVQGTVTDAGSLAPLAAAQVDIVGTGFSALTNAQGQYQIQNVPAGAVEVRVQRLGYGQVTQEATVQAGQVTTVNVELRSAAIQLDEVLVTATGVQRRRELGNTASLISAADELERAVPASMTSLIQGRASGVQVLQSSGAVGGTSTIRIRGISSISLDNTPLIYIDGSRVSNDIRSGPGVGGQETSRLNDLNPDDIASIEIVKGPSAATLYGTEAAAGVIRITTKRGQTGLAEWTFRSEVGGTWDDSDWPGNFFHPRSLLGGAAEDTLYHMNLLAGVGGPDPWRTGIEQTYGASVRGGSQGVTYYVSAELSDREGALPNNQATRRNVRGNFSFTPSDNVDVSVSSGFGSTETTLPDNDNNAFGYIGVAMLGFPWEMPITMTDPTTGDQNVETCPLDFEVARSFGLPLGAQGCAPNPYFAGRTFDVVQTLDNRQNVERFTGSATVDYRPLDFLTARGTVGYDQFADQTGSFVPVDPDLPFSDLSRGFRAIDNFVVRNFTVEGDLTARFDLTPDVTSTTSFGAQMFREKSESAGSTGRFLPAGTETVTNAVRTEGRESVTETRTIGIYGQQQFGIRDRLFITPALRVDQNSAFGEQLGWEAYPRIMASYVVSEEDWFPELGGLGMESFRVRGAWGQSGKQPSSFAALQLLSAERVSFRNVDEAGIRLTRPGNPELKPERGQEIELGFEADIFEGRVGVDFTWYHQTTQDALVTRQVAPSTGFSSSMWDNIGEIQNTGIELGLNALAVNRPNLRWDWQLNLGTAKNEITSLDDPITFGLGGNSQRQEEGHPFSGYYTYTYELDENRDVQRSAEQQIVGHPTPEWEGSVSSSVRLWDLLTLHANLGFAGGHQQFNSTEEFLCGFLGGGEYGGICGPIFETRADGEYTDMALLKQAASADIQYEPWIEDADFARLRTLSARVDFPTGWVDRIGASRASFTLSAENLVTFTSYTGLDPEINFGGGVQSTRAEFLTLPPSKRLTGRLSITF